MQRRFNHLPYGIHTRGSTILHLSAKATTNGLVKAGKSALTLGLYDNYTGVFAYSDFDIAVGAHLSENIANSSGSIIIGAVAGGAGCVGGRIGQAAKLYDLAGNAVDSARAGADMYTNGVSVSNTLQMAGAVGGGVANGLSKCFTEGTQVVVGAEYTEDDVFVQYVTVNIEDVQVGDLVYSYDTTTGEVSQKEVTAVFVRETDHLNYLTIIDGHGREQVIETTDGHPFWVVTDEPDLGRAARSVVDENGIWLYHENVGPTEHGFWVEAKDLREGDVFIGANGELSTLVLNDRVQFDETVKVYNFSVKGNHDYFVIAQVDKCGQTCVLVHNSWYDDWAPGSNKIPELNGEIHFFDHMDQFPHIETVEEYAQLAKDARDKVRGIPFSSGKDVQGATADVKRFFPGDGTYIDLEAPIPPSTTPKIVSFGMR